MIQYPHLRECPDCKTNKDLRVTVTGGKEKTYTIYCCECGVFTYFDKTDTQEELFKKWNTRSSVCNYNDENLRTCIFCDTTSCLSINSAEIISGMYKGSQSFSMLCSHCGSNTQFCDTKDKDHLIKKWNAR